jgi:hypothetical protein
MKHRSRGFQKTVYCFARFSQFLSSLSKLPNVSRAQSFWMWPVPMFPMSGFCTPANSNDSGVFYAQFLTNLKSSASRTDGFARVVPKVHCVSICIKSTSALLIQDTAWPVHKVFPPMPSLTLQTAITASGSQYIYTYVPMYCGDAISFSGLFFFISATDECTVNLHDGLSRSFERALSKYWVL